MLYTQPSGRHGTHALIFCFYYTVARAVVQPLIRMVVLCVQVFAAGGFAAAQVALGFVIQQHGAYLLPKAGGQVLQAALVLPHGTFAHAEHLRCRPHGSAALHQLPPNLHGALFGVTFHRTCPPNRFFNGMRRAVGLCGQCWRAGRRHGTIRSEQIFFSNAETLCPPGSLSQCKALQKQTQENAPMCSIKIIIVDKNWR